MGSQIRSLATWEGATTNRDKMFAGEAQHHQRALRRAPATITVALSLLSILSRGNAQVQCLKGNLCVVFSHLPW